MSFVNLPMIHPRSHPESVTVRYQRSGGRNGACLAITIGAEIVTILGWAKGDRIACLWGEGRDYGHVMLRPSSAGFKLRLTGKSNSGALTMIITTLPGRPFKDERDTLRPIEAKPGINIATPVKQGDSIIVPLPETWRGKAAGGVIAYARPVDEAGSSARDIARRLA